MMEITVTSPTAIIRTTGDMEQMRVNKNETIQTMSQHVTDDKKQAQSKVKLSIVDVGFESTQNVFNSISMKDEGN